MHSVETQRFLTSFLRRALTRHNRHVAGYFVFTLVAAAVLWAVLYGVAYWLILLALSAVKGGEAVMPQSFPIAFLAVACALLVGAWFDQLATPNALPPDEKSIADVAADFVLALPRTTLAVWANLSAWQRLSERELEQAAGLLALVLEQRRVPVHQTPLCIPDDTSRDRIIYALMLLEILELRQEESVAWLRVSPLAPARFQLANA